MNHEEEKINIDPADENTPETVAVETAERRRLSERLMMNRKIYIIGSLILLSIALILIFVFLRNDETGKPVPAPRNVSFGENETGTTAPVAERTITISDEQLKAANLKIETVGESLAGESAATAATGVVQANAYAETPVISLVGGVVRGLNAELGQFVQKGQTIATVFSDELAQTESNYLSKVAETDEAKKRYDRAVKLTGIAAESRSELDEATAAVKIAEAEHIEHLSHFRRTEKLVAIGAESREAFEMARTKHETAQAKLGRSKKPSGTRPQTFEHQSATTRRTRQRPDAVEKSGSRNVRRKTKAACSRTFAAESRTGEKHAPRQFRIAAGFARFGNDHGANGQ